jgi:ABC-type antimicrobial peptide transport system permease subunit
MVVSVAQRSREIAILRAGGVTRGQVQGLFVIEASILGALGSLFGIFLGAFLTWVLVDLARSGDFDPQFAFSAPVALLVLALGTGSAAMAAFYPARAAGATNVVNARRAS